MRGRRRRAPEEHRSGPEPPHPNLAVISRAPASGPGPTHLRAAAWAAPSWGAGGGKFPVPGRRRRSGRSARHVTGRGGAGVACAGWRARAPPPARSRRAERAVLTRQRRPGRTGPGRARTWWPSSASAWPTRSTARTSPSEGTSPRPRERPRRRRRRSGPGCWLSSSSWSADQLSSRSSRASGWACEGLVSGHGPPAPAAAAAAEERRAAPAVSHSRSLHESFRVF